MSTRTESTVEIFWLLINLTPFNRKTKEMKIKRRTLELDFETRRSVFVRNRSIKSALCPGCECEVSVSSPETAAVLANVTHQILDQMLEEGQIHYIGDPEGRILVCLKSLDQADRNA